MATEKLVDAIVRGPQPYFGKDGVLYAPGEIVRDVPANEVSDEDSRDIAVEYEANNGDLRTRKVPKAYAFRPLDGAATIAGPSTATSVATGQPDRLNVPDFLKGGTAEIVEAIASGSVDDHLGVIEQQELVKKGHVRKDVVAAIAARQAAITRP